MELKLMLTSTGLKQALQVVDAHTVGEFCRIVIGGFPEPEGNTMIEKKKWMEENYDKVRTSSDVRDQEDTTICSVLSL